MTLMSDFVKVLTLLLVIGVASPQILRGSGPQSSTPVFHVTAPKRAKYDTLTTFSASVNNLQARTYIHLLLRTGSASEIVLNQTYLYFNTDGVQTWSVVIDSQRMEEYDQSNVQLRAQHGSVIKVLDVPVTPRSGFIMIQTDKVIYTPRQTVMYRVLGLDDDQQFAQWPITVDIKNPDMIILERQHHTSLEAFKGRNFSLPRDATEGTWCITAYFEGKVRTVKTVKFDVQEYVLPTFKVQVSAQEKVVVRSTSWIRVNTKAVYSYGQAVRGRVQLRLGVVGAQSVTLFNNTYSGVLNGSGVWSFPVPVAEMRSHSAWFPDGSRLYLWVNVTEDGTGEVGSAAAMDTFFANPYYKITFTASKKFFMPGFPYSLVVDVKAANGDPASNLMVYAVVEMKNQNNEMLSAGFSSTFTLNEHGRLVELINIPPEASALRVHVYTLDPRTPDWADEEFNARRFLSPSEQFIHLHYEEDSQNVLIGYTPPADIAIGPPSMITVLVLAKGRLIHTATVPRTQSTPTRLPLPRHVLQDAAPWARLLAYYTVVSGPTSHLVSDSLLLDVPDVCRHEVELQHGPSLTLQARPKDNREIFIRGGQNMRVGLLAVDKAVYFLRDERSLSREKVFSTLGEADQGKGMGDGVDTDKVFEYSGLQYMKLTDTLEATMPVVNTLFDVSRLNAFNPQVRRGNTLHVVEAPEEQIPLEQVRKYFPESWLFKEVTLSRNGFKAEPITLPDSITTWAFTAVGVGEDGGVCMSRPLELVAFKEFFAQVRLPYKAVRLEEVTIDIGIYNYKNFNINVTVTVRGDVGLCFTEGRGGQQSISYRAELRALRTNTESLRVIPLLAGPVSLTVDIRSTNRQERDIVKKTLYVVAEGRRVQKAITFPLDPSGRHSSHQTLNNRGVQRTQTATITNRIRHRQSKQLTDVLLYMPEEVIQGSERCQISACGDLMGDILSVAVVDGDNLFESSVVDAEEAIGNLAPAVHALLYLNRSHLMTPEMLAKGQTYVSLGVSRLLTYRKPDGSFSLTRRSPSATWLTALVLKTLCQAEQITYIDHGPLITQGFAWLLDQVMQNGSMLERDQRLARPSFDYELMLSAETLIALHECSTSRPFTDDDLELMGRQELFLGAHLQQFASPLVMAKIAYALTLTAPADPITVLAVSLLKDARRTTIENLHYWSVSAQENDPPQRPFWYHSGTKASSIEATAYALLVFAQQAEARANYYYDFIAADNDYDGDSSLPDFDVNLDSIAGWLIQKRNSRGAFIGAMDTAAATQALSMYSLSKQGLQEVNLHCNVTTTPALNYTHSFDFDENNAITPKSLSNVPVGRQLRVETRGTGLGQMQIRVEYNVPVDANADCRYNVTIRRRHMSLNSDRDTGDAVCDFCNMDCDEGIRGSGRSTGGRSRRFISSSRVSICLEVCVRSAEDSYADRTILDIHMLSGFEPVKQDLERIYSKRDSLSLSSLIFVAERTSVEMKFNQIPHNRSTCVAFRAIERREVRRRNPAIVTVRAHEDPEPTCVHSYDPVLSEPNLAVYCSSNHTNNQGQCRCFSGLCGQCHSRTAQSSMNAIQTMVCNSEFIYKINHTEVSQNDDWVDITSQVLGTPKAGPVAADSHIHLVTSRNCPCPRWRDFSDPHYFFGSQVDIFVDRNNRQKKTYLVDQTTSFVSASFHNRNDPDWTGTFINMALRRPCDN